MIVRFGESTTLKKDDKYKEICLKNILKKEEKEINGELIKERENFNRNKRELELKGKEYTKYINKINNYEVPLLKKKKSKIERRIASLEKEKRGKEEKIIMNYFKLRIV